jgi:hypothetical protein
LVLVPVAEAGGKVAVAFERLFIVSVPPLFAGPVSK